MRLTTSNNRRRCLEFETDNDDDPTESFRVLNHTKIYFYGNITEKALLELQEHLHDAADYVKRHDYELTIELHILSHGGDLFAGLAGYDIIRNYCDNVCSIRGIVEGVAASAATLWILACDHVRMMPSSYFLIHQLSTGVEGKYAELKDEFRSSTEFMATMRNIYKTRSNLTDHNLDEMFTQEKYLSARECLDLGLCNCL